MKLVIAEKPSVAMSIADVIGARNRCNGYMEGNGYRVSWCVGHLVELVQPAEYDSKYEKWDLSDLPIIPISFKYKVKADTKSQFNVLRTLMHDTNINEIVCATDAGREGELIFRLVYSMAACTKPIKRLWISSMEDEEIRKGFNNLRPGIEFENLYKAAVCRQNADWLVGINGTRLITLNYGNGGGKNTLSVGRVQTATLALIVYREEEIANFVKKPYYRVKIQCENGLKAFSENIDEEDKATSIASICDNKIAVVKSVKKEDKKTAAPKLYDLTALQREANKIFGFTAKQTLDYTQALYEKKLVTYPRTDSQYLTDEMGDKIISIIDKIAAIYPAYSQCRELHPEVTKVLNSKKVTDHHAIIPTVRANAEEISKLSHNEQAIFNLIAYRVIIATAPEYKYESSEIKLECEGFEFTAKGSIIKDMGWKSYKKAFMSISKSIENIEDLAAAPELPEVSEGQKLVSNSGLDKLFTQPPAHYTEETLLAAMEVAGAKETDNDAERKGLGTTATRAEIIEKLLFYGYVVREKKTMLPTERGRLLIRIAPESLKSPLMTAEWENMLTLISKGECLENDFMISIKNFVSDLVLQTKPDENIKAQISTLSPAAALCKCPKCGGNVLRGKYGLYCESKCGMNLMKVFGHSINESQAISLCQGKKTLIKNMKNSKGTTYDAYFTMTGTEPYSYIKDGKEVSGYNYKVDVSFPKKNNRA